MLAGLPKKLTVEIFSNLGLQYAVIWRQKNVVISNNFRLTSPFLTNFTKDLYMTGLSATQGKFLKFWAAFGIRQKGHFFMKKGPQKFHPHPTSHIQSLFNPKCFAPK